MRSSVLFVVFFVLSLFGCSEETCPDDYPVRRDGFCYPADSGPATMDGSMTIDAGDRDTGTGTDGGGTGDGGGGDDGGGVICNGTHPLLDGGARFCGPGDCFCADPDNCFPAEVAAACCSGGLSCGPGTDGGATDGGSVICPGTHPLLDAGARFCGPGDCYCADPDSCFPADVAAACCRVSVVCTGT